MDTIPFQQHHLHQPPLSTNIMMLRSTTYLLATVAVIGIVVAATSGNVLATTPSDREVVQEEKRMHEFTQWAQDDLEIAMPLLSLQIVNRPLHLRGVVAAHAITVSQQQIATQSYGRRRYPSNKQID
jgi:hypothetical protein